MTPPPPGPRQRKTQRRNVRPRQSAGPQLPPPEAPAIEPISQRQTIPKGTTPATRKQTLEDGGWKLAAPEDATAATRPLGAASLQNLDPQPEAKASPRAQSIAPTPEAGLAGRLPCAEADSGTQSIASAQLPAAPLVCVAAALEAVASELTIPKPKPQLKRTAPEAGAPAAPPVAIALEVAPVQPRASAGDKLSSHRSSSGPPKTAMPGGWELSDARVAPERNEVPRLLTAAAASLPVEPAVPLDKKEVAAKATTPDTHEPAKPETPVPPAQPEPPISEEQMVQEVPAVQPAKPVAGQQPQPPPPPSRMIPPVFVVMISSELAPVAKVGGLGDVVYGLSRELEKRGNAVEIILPKYSHMRHDQIGGLTKAYENLLVPWFGGVIHTSVWFGFVHGRKCYFIEPHSPDNFFNRGAYYGQSDDVMRFAFFCRAAMEFLFKTGKNPDIIHCHDWQTALAPVLLWEMYQHLGMRHSRVCFTVHNFRHQGVAGEAVLRAVGLNRPEYYFHYDRLRDNANPQLLNLMKGGIVYANFVTTVSPRHAWEAKDDGQGHGLEPTLHLHQCKFGGVLNGLDYDQFNPETDPHIPAHYGVHSLEKKYDNKRALRQRFWLAENQKPIIAFIGRLDAQKGLDQVRHGIFYALSQQAQFVLLGNSPERGINDHFLGLKQQLDSSPDCHLEIGYHEELAHLIYAGADILIVPSRYEPCGLTQLIALRYGTVPVVRSVGGLADTVFDKDFSNRPLHERNGYVFEHPDNPGLESALHRAIRCYYDFPQHFRQLMLNGMRGDCSWNHPGQDYLNIYDYIRDK